MFLASEDEMQSTCEESEKQQNENNVSVPRQSGKRIVSGKCTGDVLGDGGIGDGAKLDNANQTGQQNCDDTKGEAHLLKCF
jgi:hypothetical protein